MVLSVFLAGLVAAAVAWPVGMGIVIGILTLWTVTLYVADNRRFRRLAGERAGEDIGSFARVFDRRSEPFDPWVVRATWDALQDVGSIPGGRLPLRPTDRLVEDLHIDPEDLSDFVAREVAERSGRSLEGMESNQYFGRVVTVGDFVRFITVQPALLGHAEAEPVAAPDPARVQPSGDS